MLTVTERNELEQMGAVNVRAKLVNYATHRRTTLNGFLRSSDPLREEIEDWLAEQARNEVSEQMKLLHATLRWARAATIASVIAIVIIGWIAWRPESYVFAMDRLTAGILYVGDAAQGGLWRR